MHNVQEHPFDTAEPAFFFVPPRSRGLTPPPRIIRSQPPALGNLATLGLGLLFVAGFWGGVYEIAKWLLRVL